MALVAGDELLLPTFRTEEPALRGLAVAGFLLRALPLRALLLPLRRVLCHLTVVRLLVLLRTRRVVGLPLLVFALAFSNALGELRVRLSGVAPRLRALGL